MGERKLGECNDVTSDRKKGCSRPVAGASVLKAKDNAARWKALELGQLRVGWV